MMGCPKDLPDSGRSFPFYQEVALVWQQLLGWGSNSWSLFSLTLFIES